MKFLSKAELPEKRVIINGRQVDVLGLASFRTEPRGMGIGRHSLRAMEDIARKKGKACVFCFCTDEVVDFYLRCGWHKIGHNGHKNVICSIPVDSYSVTEEW